jgi:hypothetical protein
MILSACEAMSNGLSQRRDDSDNRASFKQGLRSLIPECIDRIDGDVVPNDGVVVVLTEEMGNQTPAVPKLDGARVGDATERRR